MEHMMTLTNRANALEPGDLIEHEGDIFVVEEVRSVRHSQGDFTRLRLTQQASIVVASTYRFTIPTPK